MNLLHLSLNLLRRDWRAGEWRVLLLALVLAVDVSGSVDREEYRTQMQGLADGYFILPATIGNYLAGTSTDPVDPGREEFKQAERAAAERTDRLLTIKGKRTVDDFHKELGRIMWDHCGIARNCEGLEKARVLIPALREEFWHNLVVPGRGPDLNQSLERAGRVADFLEFAELIVEDALAREESCGCHLREECRTEEHEARRDDEHFSHVAVWEHRQNERPRLNLEHLSFEQVAPGRRSYK
ncbi:MAG: DUF1194 domain-containing protein [Desulfurivibrionaceae bacterium]|nr:DUF1194 domain-containing protein [Desulfurivibrionaceae bacterium]